MKYFCCLVLLLTIAPPIRAETQDEFVQRIEQAINQQDKQARYKSITALYYLEGTDEETRGYLTRILKILGNRQGAKVTLHPVTDEEFVYVLDGIEYRPNLEPVGIVKFEGGSERGGSSSLPYGARNGKYYFLGTVRRVVNASAPKDITLQMIAIGLANPPLTFDGWCDVLHSDNQLRRKTISDEGRGNTSLAFHGQRFERCEITNTAGRGSLSFRLIEGDKTVFERTIQHPRKRLRYSLGSDPG